MKVICVGSLGVLGSGFSTRLTHAPVASHGWTCANFADLDQDISHVWGFVCNKWINYTLVVPNIQQASIDVFS